MERAKSNSKRRPLCVASVVVASCLCVVALPGCFVAPVSLADSTIPVTPGSYTELGEAHGTAYAVVILGIPLSEPDPAGRARDRAIEGANADALVNVSVDNYAINLLGFVIVYTTRVHGTAINLN